MRIVAISGSLSRSSANSRVLQQAAATASDVQIQVWDGLGRLPLFSPDRQADAPVASLRAAIDAADAVWFATPEYAGGMPGALKNALDWLVGSGELYGKPVIVTSAAPSLQRGHNARRWVEEVVRMQGAEVVDSFGLAVPPGLDDADLEPATARALERVLLALGRDGVRVR